MSAVREQSLGVPRVEPYELSELTHSAVRTMDAESKDTPYQPI